MQLNKQVSIEFWNSAIDAMWAEEEWVPPL